MFGNLAAPNTSTGTTGGFGAYCYFFDRQIAFDFLLQVHFRMPTIIPPRRARCLEVLQSQRQVLAHLEVGVLHHLEEVEGVHLDPLATPRALRLGVGCLGPTTRRTVRLAIQLQGVYLAVNPLLQVLVVQVSSPIISRFIISLCPVFLISQQWNL